MVQKTGERAKSDKCQNGLDLEKELAGRGNSPVSQGTLVNMPSKEEEMVS